MVKLPLADRRPRESVVHGLAITKGKRADILRNGSVDRCFPAAFAYDVRGRSPGLEVLRHRLPGGIPSGLVMTPHFLTVAGAAPELNLRSHRLPVSLDNLTAVEHRGRAL